MKQIATKKRVRLPEVEGVYEAYVYTGADSFFNGFLVPMLPFKEAYRFMNSYNKASDMNAWMFFMGSAFFLDGMTYPKLEIQTDEGLLPLFALGSHEFLWEDESWIKAE